jgi:hypothetical protein
MNLRQSAPLSNRNLNKPWFMLPGLFENGTVQIRGFGLG